MHEGRDLDLWLGQFIKARGGVAGTVHRRVEEALELASSVNIPDKVIALTRHIPRGKGMAGLAFERDRPVTTCNLQTDKSGDVKPGARAVNAEAAVALPVHDSDGAIRAIVGIAFPDERDFGDDVLASLMQDVESMPK